MKHKIVFFITILLFANACNKERGKPEWETDILAPVINTSFTLSNIIPDSLQQTNPDNTISLVFDNSIYKFNLDTLVSLPDTTFIDTFKLPVFVSMLNVTPGQTIFTKTEENKINISGGVELTRIIIESGKIKFKIRNTINQKTTYKYTMPTATLNGVPFSAQFDVPAGTIANPITYNGVFDLSGYTFDLRGANQNSFNKYNISVEIKLANDAQATTVVQADRVFIESTFDVVRPAYVKGYFGNQQINITNQSTGFDIFKKIISGTLDINTIDVKLKLINAFGIDAKAVLNQLQSVNTDNSSTVNLIHSVIGNSVNINRASDNGQSANVTEYNIQLNEQNSNIDVFIENLPDKFNAALNLQINPQGNTSLHNDFAYNTGFFDARLLVKLPLSLIASNLQLADTFNVNLSQTGTYLKKGTFTIYANNGFPLSAQLQMHLVDANGQLLAQLFSDNTIHSAYTNSNHIVTALRQSVLKFSLNENQMQHLYDTQKMVLKVVFNTSSQSQHVDLYGNYKMDIKMTSDVKLHIRLN